MSTRQRMPAAHIEGRARGPSQSATLTAAKATHDLRATDIKEANLTSTSDDDNLAACPTAFKTKSFVEDPSTPLIPLMRLLAEHAARDHLRRQRHRGYGLIQVAICLAAVALVLLGALLLAQRLGGR